MSAKLEVLKAELEALEAADGYDAPQYDWLAEQVEKLEREEKARPPAARASAAEPASDPLQALQTEMQAAAASPERFTDQHIGDLVSRYNAMVTDAGQTHVERVDVAQVQRDMLTASADPSKLDDGQRADLLRRYDAATRQGPERRTTEALRGDLAGGDLASRMRAATELQARGLLEDGVADQVVSDYNAACEEAAARGLDIEALPPELQEAAKAILAAQAALEVPPDPADAAIHQFNQAVLKMRPPSLEEQLAELGVQPEQVPEPQEA